MSKEDKIIDRVMMIDQWKVAGDIYTQDELNAIGKLLDLYNKEKEYAMGLYYDVQGLQQDLDKKKEKNKKIEDKIKGKINNLEIFRKTLPIRATEIERFIGELKDLLEE